MSLIISASLFALGSIVASFVGVVVARLHTGQSFITGRSHCDACGKSLKSLSLVPIFSYAATRGRALCCGARISLISPITEILLGSLFVLAYVKVGFSAILPFLLVSFSLLLAIVLYDLVHQILPPVFLGLFVFFSAIAGFLGSATIADFLWTFFTASLIGLSLATIHFLSRGRAMGLADAPFSFGLALLTGPVAFAGFVFSFWIGAVVGIVVLARRPVGSRMGVEVPFAPFLAAGFLLAYFTQWNPFILIATLIN